MVIRSLSPRIVDEIEAAVNYNTLQNLRNYSMAALGGLFVAHLRELGFHGLYFAVFASFLAGVAAPGTPWRAGGAVLGG